MANDKIEKNKISAKMKGKVVSDKTEKTLVVAVSQLKAHSKYKKKYQSTKRYKVHDEEKKYKVGDAVEFILCRPISKHKKYRVL